VKKAVTTVGPMVLGVPVELEKASVSPLRGKVALEGFALGSPEGFEAPEMFRVGRVSVHASIMSFLSDELVVHEVEIDAPEMTLEVEGTRTNWGALIAQLEKEEEEAAEAPAEEAPKAQKKIRVGVIRFTNGKVKITGVPLAGSEGIPLPSLEVTDFGTADAPAVTIATMAGPFTRRSSRRRTRSSPQISSSSSARASAPPSRTSAEPALKPPRESSKVSRKPSRAGRSNRSASGTKATKDRPRGLRGAIEERPREVRGEGDGAWRVEIPNRRRA